MNTHKIDTECFRFLKSKKKSLCNFVEDEQGLGTKN